MGTAGRGGENSFLLRLSCPVHCLRHEYPLVFRPNIIVLWLFFLLISSLFIQSTLLYLEMISRAHLVQLLPWSEVLSFSFYRGRRHCGRKATRRTEGQTRAIMELSPSGTLIRGAKILQIDLDCAPLLFFLLYSLRVTSRVGPRIRRQMTPPQNLQYRDRWGPGGPGQEIEK